jgi:hypothetical protein
MDRGLGGATVYSRRADVLWRRTLDTVILFPVGAEEPVTMPGTGAVVWDLLEEPATLAELVDTLADVYGEDAATIEHDVAALLEQLRALAAVTTV